MTFKLLPLLVLAVASLHLTAAETSSRDISILGFDSQEDLPDIDPEPYHTKEVSSIVGVLKQQIRGIIEEISHQVLKYLKDVFFSLKLKILKKLGLYTVSDMLYYVSKGVEGLFDFDSVEEESFLLPAAPKPVPLKPSYMPYAYGSPYYGPGK